MVVQPCLVQYSNGSINQMAFIFNNLPCPENVFSPFFSPIDAKLRHKTRGHIALSFHHHNISRVDATSIENIIYEKSTFISVVRKAATIFEWL